ncbi:MAG: TrkA family potassium uptake protein [Calothrix sp. SM1_7_51]|nr:TrkA family potassium uptake protein [Calothrix sp. SM1_7_51]
MSNVPLYYLYKFEKPGCLVLSHNSNGENLPTQFHQWNPFEIIKEGDEIAYITVDKGNNSFLVNKYKNKKYLKIENLLKFWQKNAQNLVTIWQQAKMYWLSIKEQQSIPLVLLVGIIWLSLLPLGMIILMVAQNKPLDKWLDIFYATFVMLLGAYNEVLDTQYRIEIRIMNLIWMIAGIITIAVLNSKLTQYFVSTQLRLPVNRRPIPENNHIVLIGLGRVGTRVAKFLQNWNKSFLGVDSVVPQANTLTQVPLVIDNLSNALDKVNLKEARSVVIVTNDEMVNLQLAIIAQKINPNIPVIIRTTDPNFSNDIKKLLPKAKAMCIYALSAEAFVVAALGENILDVLRLNEQTILITEYTIRQNDTLNGLRLSDVAYGYGVVPIFYQKPNEESLMPSNNIKLESGDRLVVVAGIESLKK